MEKKYTYQDIGQFYIAFKNLSNSFELEKVYQLINNPYSKARYTVKLNSNPFKFIIMTSTFIIGFISLLFLFSPLTIKMNSDQKGITNNKKVIQTQTFDSGTKEIKNNKADTSQEDNFIINLNINQKPEMGSYTIECENILSTSVISTTNSTKQDIIDTCKQDIVDTWPSDSVFFGEQFLVTLSIEEAQKIGVAITENGVIYKDKTGRLFAFTCKKTSENEELTSQSDTTNWYNTYEYTSNNDFYPVIVSDIFYYQFRYDRNIFALMNDTLMPISIKDIIPECGFDNRILWYTITENLFNQLPARYKYLKCDMFNILKYKRQYGNRDIVKYGDGDLTESIKMIELTASELQKFGFIIKDTNIQWRCFFSERGFEEFNYSKNGPNVSHNADLSIKDHGINIILITNKYGEQNLRWGDQDKKKSYEYFRNNRQLLVPIILRQSNFVSQLEQDLIFWFEPSENLFNSLPEVIGIQLRQEYNYIIAESNEERKSLKTNCTYFEECRSTLFLENFKIYPNPTNGIVNIEFFLTESLQARISLFDINGREIKVIMPNNIFYSGNNSFQAELSDVMPGIYLLKILSNKGFKTHRIIITR